MHKITLPLLAFLLLNAFPVFAGNSLQEAGLVDVTEVIPSIILDIRYATANNFTGQPVYPSAACYLRQDVAQRLKKVQEDLASQGLGLKVFDCYRPFSVQKRFWAITPDERYVSKPTEKNGKPVEGSRHNRGAAVDVTLVDASGKEPVMPTPYDDFTVKAHRNHRPSDPAAERNSHILETAMARQGFVPLPTEWWHFDGPGWEGYDLLDVPFK